MVVHDVIPAWETETGGSPEVEEQPSLPGEFQALQVTQEGLLVCIHAHRHEHKYTACVFSSSSQLVTSIFRVLK